MTKAIDREGMCWVSGVGDGDLVEEEEVESVNPSFATIMAKHKPNPWGKGHLQLYALATICFLNSTMSGMSETSTSAPNF